MSGYRVNPGKQEFVEYRGERYGCYAIQTEVVTIENNLEQLIGRYAAPVIETGDIVFLSEKMIACAEGRARPVREIRPGKWAVFLSRFVTKSPYGIGLAMPETMQCAIDDCGLPRILLAAAAGMAGRFFGRKGWFYRVAGTRAAAVDGPCSYTLPPYNHCVVMAPDDPDGTAAEISAMLGGNLVLVIDANDLGIRILGASEKGADLDKYAELLRQNPLGQSRERTPIGFLRPLGRRRYGEEGSLTPA